jgi:hypothetical protein
VGNADKITYASDNRIDEIRAIEIDAEYDCIVVGCGIAGIAAALAATRHGSRTLIIEKSIMPGGLATIGFVNKYLPLCDGNGHKVCGGISEELLYESIRYGYSTLPEEWDGGALKRRSARRYMTIFSPYDFVMALDELLEREKIDVLYDTLFSSPVTENGVCKAVIVESKRGRHAFGTKVVVDCTGDADVLFRCKSACEESGNWLSYWAYISSNADMRKGAQKSSVMRGIPLWEKGATADGKNTDAKTPDYSLLTPEGVTRFVLDGRRLFRDEMNKRKSAGLTIAALPAMAQMRKTRRIKGSFELTEKHLNCRLDHSIGCAPDWRTRGEVYEIPFAALYCDEIKNVLTAGRSISATGDTWEVTRAIPACAVTGQAAGTAAAMMSNSGCGAQELNISELCDALRKDGVILHIADAD